jgi:anti-anti-sigma factor
MKLEQTVKGNVAVLSVTGEMDASESKRLEEAAAASAGAGVPRVVVSLEKLTFIDSTALGSFLRAQETLRKAGGELACASLTKFTAKNFRLLGLDQRVKCFATLDEAVGWVGSQKGTGA